MARPLKEVSPWSSRLEVTRKATKPTSEKMCVKNDVRLKRDILKKQLKKDFKVEQLYLDAENNLRELEMT
jgi:hypothetical protein